jgi:hypothetical protein
MEEREIKIIRVVDLDGMGGKEYEYHCGNCNCRTNPSYNYCAQCGSKFTGVDNKDSWGING